MLPRMSLGVDVVQVLRGHGFDRAVGADGHEHGSFDGAVVEFERAAAGVASFLCRVKLSIVSFQTVFRLPARMGQPERLNQLWNYIRGFGSFGTTSATLPHPYFNPL